MSEKSTGLVPYRSSLAGTLLAARESAMAPIRPILRAAGMTDQQWRVLRVLTDEGTIDTSGLAEAAMLHAPSVTRILRELSDRGLIERRADPKDGRRSIVAITASGRKLVQATARETRPILDQYAERFGRERITSLRAELAAFAAAVADLSPATRIEAD